MAPILICVDTRAFGGIESHILALATALHQVGRPVCVLFCRDYGRHPLKDKLTAVGVPWQAAVSTADLLRRVRTADPLLIHTHGYKANIIGRLVRASTGIPVVATYHAGEPGRGKLRLYMELDRITGIPFQKIAVSARIAERLYGPVTVMNNFIPLSLKPAPLVGRRVLFIGRLSPEKGPDLFCDLAARVPDADFICLGEGPMRADLEPIHGHRVRFEGAVADVSKWLDEAALVVMPSRHEGLPMAALEAMAKGVPVAAFGVGGLPTLIDDGRSGYLAPPSDMEGLARRISAHLSRTVPQRLQMGQAARSRITADFTPEQQLPELLAIYEQAGRRYAETFDAVAS
ncbi:MAG: glycosyltransferase family 4 protein [Alphaproteobacteria bacterium]|nr:glycosyltransferase family 4 protein [Alphaproteobacteria bacterium]